MKRKPRPLLLAPLLMLALLLCSCSTSKAARQSIDPVAALSFSSGGAEPAAFAVLPPSFVLPALEELEAGASGADGAAVSFLNEFFGRADCVFASIMCNSDTGALFCRVLAFGKFPASAFRMLLSSSREWQKKEEGGALWFESAAFAGGRAMRAAIPASGVLLAEIEISAPSKKGGAGSASSSMQDFIAAATSRQVAAEELPQSLEASGGGDGTAFFSALDAALLGAANTPIAFYAPDFNLFMRMVLPLASSSPLAGAAAALSTFDGFSLPVSSIEFIVEKSALNPAEDGSAQEMLTVRAAVPSKALVRAASVIVRLIFPEGDVAAEDGAITVIKELPAGRAALAILSFFLLS